MSKADGTEPISNTEDVIDSRDIIARIEYLKGEWIEATGDEPSDYSLSEDDWAVGIGADAARELVSLLALQEQAEGYIPDWQYGETLISEDYFVTYAEQLAEDIGAIDRDASWPLTYIDWEKAADALLIDYTSLEFDGVTYYAR